MTNDAADNLPRWLDPQSDDFSPNQPLSIDRGQLQEAGRRILGEPLAAQRLITASQLGLKLSESNENQELNIKSWGHTFPSAVAVLMPYAESVKDAAEKRIRRKYQERLLINQEKWPDLATTSDTAFLLCADHKPPEYGLPDQLYNQHNPSGLLEWNGVSTLLDQLIKAVSPAIAPTWIKARPALREALATIFSETFKNTHDHGRDDINGSHLQTSIRGVYARYYPISDALIDIASIPFDSVTPAERYVRSFAPQTTKPGVRAPDTPHINGFLELSILDSGPGMAARWLRQPVREIAASEQLTAVLECLKKGRSTTGAPERGFGLWKVFSSLFELHGFISIRTNNIHAYRQFGYLATAGHEELPSGQRVPKEELYDWKRGLSPVQSSYPHLQGTVVSFLFPMGQE